MTAGSATEEHLAALAGARAALLGAAHDALLDRSTRRPGRHAAAEDDAVAAPGGPHAADPLAAGPLLAGRAGASPAGAASTTSWSPPSAPVVAACSPTRRCAASRCCSTVSPPSCARLPRSRP